MSYFDQENFNTSKKLFNYYVKRVIFLSVVALLFYFAINLGLAYHKITIQNEPNKTANISNSTQSLKDIIKEEELYTPKKESDRLDILVLGIRGDNDQQNGGLLTDSIVILSLNKKTGQTAIMSVPRDLFVNIKETFAGKVNEIYEVGLKRGKAFDFTKETFSKITGVYIDNVVIFDFQSFEKIIDTIGGIDITLEKPFEETQQWGYKFFLPAGKNHLDKEQALYYVRSRYTSSDFDRARRQQEVILAIKEKIVSLGILANPLKLNSLITVSGDAIKTDLSIWNIDDLLDLSKSLKAVDSSPKHFIMTTENVLYETIQQNIYILLPQMDDHKVIQNKLQNIFQSQ